MSITTKYVQPNIYFRNNNFEVDSSAAFLRNVAFDSSVYLKGTTHISSPIASIADTPYALIVETIGANVEIKQRQLGTMAWKTAADYDTSLGDLWTYNGIQDSSIALALNGTLLARNGLTIVTDGSKYVELGGTLDSPVTIVTSAINTFSITGLPTETGDTPYALVINPADSNIKIRELGTMAWETSTNYVLQSLFDSSILAIWNYNTVQDSSIAAALAGTTKAWNGLTRTDNSIGLGGRLDVDTTIDVGTQTLTISGLSASTTDEPYALIMETVDGNLVYRQLGTMAWAPKAAYDASILIINNHLTALDASITVIDASIVRIDASLNAIYGNAITDADNGLTKNGQTAELGGTLNRDTDIATDGHTLSITGGLDIYGTLTVDGSVSYVNVVDLNVSDNIITLNYGETGSGVSKGFAGIKIDRGTEDDYVFVFAEATDTFRIGVANESGLPTGTQAVATREDAPETWGVAYWNGTEFRFDTSSGFTFQPGVGLSLPIATNDPTEATALMINGTGLVVSRELGTGAFANIEDYATIAYVDGSLAIRDASIVRIDASLNAHEASINYLGNYVVDLSTNKLNAVANIPIDGTGYSIYSEEVNNVAYLKQIVAGTGATIAQDGSTITISVTGASGYVSKYIGTFDGTAGTEFTISAATHGLGSGAPYGPYTITVFENDDMVFTGVEVNSATGDVILRWTAGSLTDTSCRFIISG